MLSKSWRRRQRVLVVLAATSVVCAIAASSASAALERLPNGQVASYVPLRTATAVSQARRFDTAFNNLDYNGGALMPSNTDTIVVWAPKGSATFPAGYVDGVKTYFKNLQHDNGGRQNVESVATQYNDLTGAVANYAVTYGGTIVDRDPYPASQCPVIAPNTNCLVDAQIQAELQKVATAYHLKRDLEHEVFLLTPPKVQGCFTNDPSTNYGFCTAGIGDINLAGYCAYHQETLASPMLFYSNDPYQFDAAYKDKPLCTDGNSPNGVADAAMETGLSHEHNESITDPIPNDTWTNGTGPNHGQENGDQCAYNYGEPLGTVNGVPYNQVINGHKYWYQQEWSNAGHTCLQRLTLPSSLPHAAFSATAGTGTNMTFDASNSGPSIAFFSWQFNDSDPGCTTCNSTIETTAPTITHTFPQPGAYDVGLAVFQADGLSQGVGGIVTTGQSGFTPGFTFAPAHPGRGEPVTFTALAAVSRLPVSNVLWEFGDGSSGSGLTPTHSYKKKGTYRVKAVLYSGVGSAFPGDGAAPVAVETVTVG